ncbi:oxidoreductase domain protein [Neocallimastix californiae]|uniref:Oxidoreductase domain protein n=1 Tax=Neocallimastix californiae TaxID=1754190 RepID=A0A1Y2ESY1_9FUNG|nr:oxidoreductase domain protein [Neocallimastix californiae]|eukprot:ORY74652.1 oxidoreductase domain protein [Neocallimastix californiae]
MKLALIGAGQRGMIYSRYAYEKRGAEIVAVVDINEEKREIAAKEFNVPRDMLFDNIDDFYHKGKIADAVILATMDRDHYRHVMPAIDLGYDILLEKPISPDIQECLKIQKNAHKNNVKIVVCHVLRYTQFFSTIKQVIDSGELGRIITIQHAENIGNFHMAHSFVRGNWRNSDETSPIIMQKSCHDMDILLWLVDSECEAISSFGNLSFFKEENAPEGSTTNCLDCPLANQCRFDGRKAYLPVMGDWPATVLTEDQTEKGILKALREGPYGRCVFRCDNNVCDNQTTNILFKNGVTATFHLSGFTNKMHRTIKIMCENGDIYGDDSKDYIIVSHYSANSKYEGEVRKVMINNEEGFHGGGDYRLTMDFMDALEKKGVELRTSIDRSIESHLMAYAAEQARVNDIVIHMDDLRK